MALIEFLTHTDVYGPFKENEDLNPGFSEFRQYLVLIHLALQALAVTCDGNCSTVEREYGEIPFYYPFIVKTSAKVVGLFISIMFDEGDTRAIFDSVKDIITCFRRTNNTRFSNEAKRTIATVYRGVRFVAQELFELGLFRNHESSSDFDQPDAQDETTPEMVMAELDKFSECIQNMH